jgi:hypothetical protein
VNDFTEDDAYSVRLHHLEWQTKIRNIDKKTEDTSCTTGIDIAE